MLQELRAYEKINYNDDLFKKILESENAVEILEKSFSYAEEEYEEVNNTYAQLHAILLLSKLDSKKSFPVILDFLKKETDLLDYLLGAFISEGLWFAIAKLGRDNLGDIKNFILTPTYNLFIKLAMIDGLKRVATSDDKKFDEVISIFKELVNIELLHVDIKALALKSLVILDSENSMELAKEVYENIKDKQSVLPETWTDSLEFIQITKGALEVIQSEEDVYETLEIMMSVEKREEFHVEEYMEKRMAEILMNETLDELTNL